MGNRTFCIALLFLLLTACSNHHTTVNETCFKKMEGIITAVDGTSGINYMKLKGEAFEYMLFTDTTCCTIFRDVAQPGDSIIRKGNYLELHHKNTMSNWHLVGCEDIPYTTNTPNFAYTKGFIDHITDEDNTYYHYHYIVNGLKYTGRNIWLDNTNVGDTLMLAYVVENPKLNRIFDRQWHDAK
jgi:hypothetical protein